MKSPHAICIDGEIWWRGSRETFAWMHPQTARNLLPNLTREIAYLAPDLKAALEAHELYHEKDVAA